MESLIHEVHHYAQLLLLRGRFLATAHLSYIIAAVVFAIIVVPIIVLAICYFSFSLLHLLLICLSPVMAYAIVGVILLLVVALLYLWRKPMLLNPITRIIARMILDNDNHEKQ